MSDQLKQDLETLQIRTIINIHIDEVGDKTKEQINELINKEYNKQLNDYGDGRARRNANAIIKAQLINEIKAVRNQETEPVDEQQPETETVDDEQQEQKTTLYIPKFEDGDGWMSSLIDDDNDDSDIDDNEKQTIIKQINNMINDIEPPLPSKYRAPKIDINKPMNINDVKLKPLKNKIIPFNDFVADSVQSDLVDNAMKQLKESPTKWFIDFSLMNKETRKAIFESLENYLKNDLGEMVTSNKFMIKFKVNGQIKTKPLTSELFDKLNNNFSTQSFVYDIDLIDPSYSLNNVSDALETELINWSLFDALGIEPINEKKGEKLKSGSFFKFINLSDIDLSECQIFERLNKVGHIHVQRDELNDTCFIYALKTTGLFSTDELNKMRQRLAIRYQKPKHLNLLCEENKIKVIIHDLEDDNNGHSKVRINKKDYLGVDGADRVIEMNYFKHHYFIEKRTEYTTDYINHKYINKEDVPNSCYNKRYSSGRWKKTDETRRFITYGSLVKLLYNNNYFRPTTYNEEAILNNVNLNNVDSDDITDLSYNPKTCVKLISSKKKDKEGDKTEVTHSYYYADFEADVGKTSDVNNKNKYNQIHQEYMVCIQSADGNIKRTYVGLDCGVKMLDFLPDNAIVYFHNLGYDIRFFAKYGIKRAIIKGSRTMKASIEYKNKIIEFRDTLPILSCKLSAMPKMFNIEGIKKELFPYNYYTIERVNNNKGVINEAGKFEAIPWGDDEYKTFIENIDAIPGCRIDADSFDMVKYAAFYCMQDVNVLRQSFEKFCSDFSVEFGLNPKDFISAPSLANEYFNVHVYNDRNLYKVGGHVRLFMQNAIKGGRCMCAFNKRWNVEGKISDYDAVSLYPSAMNRLWTVEGMPEVLKVENADKVYSSMPEYLKKYGTTSEDCIGAFVIEILIMKVNKHYAFPIIVRNTDNGNLNDDKGIDEQHPLKLTVDNITLEDLIEFHKIDFKVIRGYVWNGKRDKSIQGCIQTLFNKRLEYKKAHNSLEQLYKLIMNSCYGKTIEKPVTKEWKFINDVDVYNKKTKTTYNQLDNFYINNYNSIVEDVKLYDSDIHAIRCYSPIDEHFNFSLLGIQVLSMSKRITNEVSCLAFDLGCHVYYTDTDSFHLRTDDIPILEQAYKQKYGRELKGKQMGQFHSDFPIINGHEEVPISKHSIFIGKKLYMDELTDSSGEIDYMVRGKGLTQNSIKYEADKLGGYVNLYTKLFNGDKVVFDLTNGSPSFTLNKDMTISTNSSFKREAKTTYEEGDDFKYFDYANEKVN